MVRTPNSPQRWFDQITLTPTRKTRSQRWSNHSLPHIHSSPIHPSTNHQVEDLFASIHSRNRELFQPNIPRVDSQSAAERIKVLDEQRLELAKVALEKAEKAKERARTIALKRRKRKRQRWLADKKDTETERQRSILAAITTAARKKRYATIRNDVTVALSPFSRNRQKSKQAQLSGACRQQKRRRANGFLHGIQKEFKDDVAKWNDLGDPYGGMRRSIHVRKLHSVPSNKKKDEFSLSCF